MIASLTDGRVPRYAALLFFFMLVSGCATTNAGDPRDPFEGFNRGVYKFNQTADEYFFNPIGRGYNTVTPEVVNKGVTNFFSNLGEVANFANNLMQLKLDAAGTTVVRFFLNSTLGIGGFFDVAEGGAPKEAEDFGQTLGYWGIDAGPYLVLPILGPSTVRDGVGLAADVYMNPVTYFESDALRFGLLGLVIVDTKADLLRTEDLIREAALDEYDFVKNAYFERRRNLIEDDAGPDYESFEEFDEEVDDES